MTPAEKSEPHKHLSRQQYLYSFIPSTSLVATEAGIGQRGAPGAHGLGQVTLDGNTSSESIPPGLWVAGTEVERSRRKASAAK
jgi:hypothetical protein